jgi:hypothetical protein
VLALALVTACAPAIREASPAVATAGPASVAAAAAASLASTPDPPPTDPSPPVHGSAPLAATPGPLTAEQRARLWDTPEGSAAVELGGVTEAREGRHYVAGNEKALHLFRPRIDRIGGGYVGVGSDQGYLFLGWGRFDVAWLVDYDPLVMDVHACYQAFFAEAATPEQFLELWSKPGQGAALAVLEARVDESKRARAVDVYRRWRGWIERRLLALAKRYRKLELPSFVSDADTYAFVREAVAAGRVRPMLVNLLEDGALDGIADAARDLGVPIRVLYLSNAEEYWDGFPAAYRANVGALGFDDRAVVLRTLLTWQDNQDYRYAAQPARNYRDWLAQPWLRTVYDIELDVSPAASRAGRRAAAGAP